MVSISEARTQISQARQTIQKRRQESLRARNQLQRAKESLKSTQRNLRQQQDALKGRAQRQKAEIIKRDISSREESIEQFGKQLTEREAQIRVVEKEVGRAQEQIKLQKEFEQDIQSATEAFDRGSLKPSASKRTVRFFEQLVRAGGSQRAIRSLREQGFEPIFVSGKLAGLEDIEQGLSIQLPSQTLFQPPTQFQTFLPKTPTFLQRSGKALMESETFGEFFSTTFPEAIPEVKQIGRDFSTSTTEGRILKEVAKRGLDITKLSAKKVRELELKARGISVTEENIAGLKEFQEQFRQQELTPTLTFFAIGAGATPTRIVKTFSFFGKTQPSKLGIIEETRIIKRTDQLSDFDVIAVRAPQKDILGEQLFLERTGTVKLTSDLAKRPFGSQEKIVRGAAVIKQELPKLPKPSGKFKEFQEPLSPFRDKPTVKSPFEQFKSDFIPKKITKKTPLSTTFPRVIDVSKLKFEPSPFFKPQKIKKIKIKKIEKPESKPMEIKIFGEQPKEIITPKRPGQQLQLLQKPKVKEKPIPLIQFQALTEKELKQLRKIRAAPREQPSFLEIQSELFPSPEKIKVTRFSFEEISKGKIKPSGIFGVSSKEEAITKELEALKQPSALREVPLELFGTPQKEIISEKLFQPQKEGISEILKQPLLSKSILKGGLKLRNFIREALKTKITEKAKPRVRKFFFPAKKGGDRDDLISALKKLKGKGVNVIVGMEEGKQKIIFKNLPPKKAYMKAQDFVDRNIEASFRLEASGKKIKAKDIKKIIQSAKFRFSKRDPLFQVEKRKFRLDHPNEKRQIKQARQKKSKFRGKKNVFGL